jgi:hypothetical protein
MIPNELCHYTTRETALEKILFNKQIKLGRLGSTNDPKEAKARSHLLISDVTDKVHKQINSISKTAEKVSKDEWKVFCLTKSLPINLENTRKNVYLSFFAHGYSRPRMWAQYGENHSGVCLIFDGECLSKKLEGLKDKSHTLFHGSVSYDSYNKTISKPLDFSDIKDLGKLTAIRKHYFDNYEYFFLSKHPDWRDETEYRWLVHNSGKKKDEFINIEGALVAVLVGVDFPKVYEIVLRELCKELNVSAGKMAWINGFPMPNFGSIYNPNPQL